MESNFQALTLLETGAGRGGISLKGESYWREPRTWRPNGNNVVVQYEIMNSYVPCMGISVVLLAKREDAFSYCFHPILQPMGHGPGDSHKGLL